MARLDTPFFRRFIGIVILTVGTLFTGTATATATWGPGYDSIYLVNFLIPDPAVLPDLEIGKRYQGAVQAKLAKSKTRVVSKVNGVLRAGGNLLHNPRHGRTRHWQAINKKLLGAGGQPHGANSG